MQPSMAPPDLARISDYVAWYAARMPQAEALVLGARRLDYADLAREVDAAARSLLAADVRTGDRVAMLSPPNPDFFVVFLAAASIGAVWLGLNPRYQRDELQFVLRDSRPKLILARARIGARDYLEDIEALQTAAPSARWVMLGGTVAAPGHLTHEEFIAAGAAVADAALARARDAVDTHDAALIVYTSGSSGRPKGALLSHHGLVVCSRVQHRHWATVPLRTVNFFPINHIAAVGDIGCFTLVGGGCMVFLEQFFPAEALAILAGERITFWAGVPTMFLLMLRDPAFATADLSSIQRIIWSGAAASAELVDALLALGKWLGASYGLTETVGSVTYTDQHASREVLIETVGRPPPEYAVRVAEGGRAVGSGTVGEVQVHGSFLMLGYWEKPDATREACDAAGWLKTGDLGIWRSDGNLAIIGRRSDAFKSGGYNVYPREIERVLECFPGIGLAAVVAVADPLYGHVGRAYVTPEAHSMLDVDELQRHCRRHLANYKVPKKISILADPPMLPVGKIDKRALAALAASELAAGD
ncbi:MAG TPA: class I adenylate-forming enzyme family protein [Steroidobacteraceae bacterium]|jgi:acyl-CoA synthetase (AMP-forming)/AMP-acid ligase II|nr:class I adenylate-forming enzyme family protein [Steroidobacteraceae bacterium]